MKTQGTRRIGPNTINAMMVVRMTTSSPSMGHPAVVQIDSLDDVIHGVVRTIGQRCQSWRTAGLPTTFIGVQEGCFGRSGTPAGQCTWFSL